MAEVAAVKDATSERPIPSLWRPALCGIVAAFVKGDFLFAEDIAGVEAVSQKTASHIQSYLRDYGATLEPLPNAAWDSSVCIWAGTHWDFLVDLYTQEESPSDLVLSGRVTDTSSGFRIAVHMVHVP